MCSARMSSPGDCHYKEGNYRALQRHRILLRLLNQFGIEAERCRFDQWLSIDEFGTGYSSLKYLHRFSVNTLKIDRYFVFNMAMDERNLNMVRTIVSLDHNLHIEVVAEGAETSEQVNLLTAMNCDWVRLLLLTAHGGR